ncbi:NfeD family protein [Nocardioides bruguierae]|uniref:NfeD family protein n=1 Tax=Nocardioides bruguierae TaxID=2945102 RepID=A0A9X2ID63_9ACTN|nr:NfeD family protein [Nocardioides bruguierae]MCL8025822.1 NfeD family protein [Nocardioides bruguierae]MCM0618937.1 NfeD family protein [Nocardioides bruguierae]
MDWLSDHGWAVWLGLAVLLGVGEMLTLDLILAMLAVGALTGMVAGLLDAPLVVQALVALASSAATLALLRPRLIGRLHRGPDLVIGPARLIGTQGEVLEAITGNASGTVRLGHDTWTAVPYDPTLTIAPGEQVEVMEIRGARAVVHPVSGFTGLGPAGDQT